jgi:hypothetical protein
MAETRNFYSAVVGDIVSTLYKSFTDAEKARPIPFGQQVPTSKAQREQAWRTRIMSDGAVFQEEFLKDKEAFTRRWEA